MSGADPIAAFFAMGGYGAYVWPSYAIALAVILGMATHSVLARRRWRDHVRSLEKDRGGA